jgi:preprotein translocase SecE subunit
MNSLFSYLRSVRAELDHVVWPSQRTAFMHVALIILISIFTALFVTGLDYVFTHLIERLIAR